MTTLVTEQEFRFGQENIIPFAGKVQISSEGLIEVEDSVAQSIVDCNCGFAFTDLQATTTTTIAETTTTTTIERTTTTTTQEEFGKEESQDLGKQEEDQLGAQEDQDDLQKSDTIETVLDENVAKAALEAKNLNELKEMAKPFPSAEWRTLNKSELIDYILEKIK